MEDISFASLKKGGKRALAGALAKIEQTSGETSTIALLDEAFVNPQAHVIGFTGPPGVGKSTLINVLIKTWRARGETVGVIAVDPSSHVSGGALLGDRIRMITDPEDPDVFVRSLASRGQLGGLSELTFPSMVLMRALFDRVIIESVGVGQSEADISSVADTVVLCVQPGSGDSLQFMKAGIMEIPHIALVTKADFGDQARRSVGDLEGALSLFSLDNTHWQVKTLAVSGVRENGIECLIDAINQHHHFLMQGEKIAANRSQQGRDWLENRLRHKFGAREG